MTGGRPVSGVQGELGVPVDGIDAKAVEAGEGRVFWSAGDSVFTRLVGDVLVSSVVWRVRRRWVTFLCDGEGALLSSAGVDASCLPVDGAVLLVEEEDTSTSSSSSTCSMRSSSSASSSSGSSS